MKFLTIVNGIPVMLNVPDSGSSVLFQLYPPVLPSANPPQPSVKSDLPAYLFDPSGTESLDIIGWAIGLGASDSVNVKLTTSGGGTSGSTTWEIKFQSLTANAAPSGTFLTGKTLTIVNSSTNGGFRQGTLNFTSTEHGITDNEPFRMRISRLGADSADTAGSDTALVFYQIYK